ncbi:unnamed protein product [Hydatigera taeniaeformis]|uniref:Rod_C domain-containing protein n=1 Tax=Hydatigena taeniaeformis TaxID=6205 RepID=A0A0R3WMT8_HYDTA|nr:unnamed protein product [Hydatigera taeniaeformis]
MYFEQDILCFIHLVEQSSSFIKYEYIGLGYLAVLTDQHLMLIFNAIARVCSGVLCDSPDVIDFAINLRKEEGKSMSFDLYTLHTTSSGLLLRVQAYPSRNLRLSIPLTAPHTVVFSRNHLSSEPLLVEQEGAHLKVSTFLLMDLTDHLKIMVREKKFAEARQFAMMYGLSTCVIAQFEFQACLETLVANTGKLSHFLNDETSNAVIFDCDSICERAIKLLDDFTVVESSEAIIRLTKSGIIPSVGKQYQLLERVLDKAVAVTLKGLEAFRKLKKYRDLSCISWNKFISSGITTEFAECFTKWEDYSDGFTIWGMFKTDLTLNLTVHSVAAFLSILSLKPLTSDCVNLELERLLVETENALHTWLGTELVPALVTYCPSALPLLSKWLVNRIRQLEGFVKSSGVHCCFDWPEAAISWSEVLLSRAKPATCGDEMTSQEEVDFLVSGLYSRSAEVDPFYDLRCLLFDLVTIKNLVDKYNFKLDLASCRTMDAKSIAFKLIDVAVTSYSACDKTTILMDRVINFMGERGLYADSVYSDYCFNLLAAFKSHTLSQNDTTFTNDRKQLTLTESNTSTDLIHRACLVASWIISLDYRYRTAQFLAKVTPMPWPDQLHAVVDSVFADCSLSCCESMYTAVRVLSRQSNRAKANSILSSYGVELDTRPGFGLARSLSGLLLHASPAWVTIPSLGLSLSRSLRTRQEVLAAALQVAQLLAMPSQCSPDPPVTASHALAVVHLRLALHQTILCPIDHLDVHQRVHYLLSTVFEEVLALEQAGGQSFVESLFAEALNDLVALWDVTRCGSECGSDKAILRSAFKHSSSDGPFDPQSVALFNLLLQWTQTKHFEQLEEADVDILLVETWLTDKLPIKTVVMVMEQLLERLNKFEGSVVTPSIAHRFVVKDVLW